MGSTSKLLRQYWCWKCVAGRPWLVIRTLSGNQGGDQKCHITLPTHIGAESCKAAVTAGRM